MISILIPARNEQYLNKTIEDIQQNATGDIEILVGLDGWDVPFAEKKEGVTFLELDTPIGQRAITNRLAEMAKYDVLMKTDAHCSYSEGFDQAMLALFEPDMLMAPVLLRLDAENWQIKPKPRCICYGFDKNLIFDYWHEYEEGQEGDLAKTLTLQGSSFMLTKKNYFDLNICDESFGSWGQQGVEIGLKFWLTGQRVFTNRKAYYGHMFRGLEEFPYERDMEEIERCKKRCYDLFVNNKWEKATRTFNDVLEDFGLSPQDYLDKQV